MVSRATNVGQESSLIKRLAKTLASLAIVGTCALGVWSFAHTPTVAGGETRTISMYHQHTKERITVTYMKDGRYVPSAMKKLNHFLRDWRRNEVITIDPKTIDLVWELHADLGSKAPIHIVSGYRSPKTNAFLKRIGRKVAKRSQHMRGKAIDFFFPDVKTLNIRNSALPRRVGGVGYYRSSGGPTGFLHVDSGNVRTWGPAISRSQMAQIMRDGPKTIGKRLKGKRSNDMVAVADSDDGNSKKKGSLIGWITGSENEQVVDEPVAQLEGAYALDGGELAALSADASAPAKQQPVSPVYDVEQVQGEDEDVDNGTINADKDGMANMAQTASVEELASRKLPNPVTASGVIKPRLKPKEVLAVAMAEMPDDVVIEPASAPPESQVFKKGPSPVADTLAALEATEPTNPLYDGTSLEDPISNSEGKSNFAEQLRDGTAEEVPLIEPLMASLDGQPVQEPSWFESFFMTSDEMVRRNGAPTSLDVNFSDVLPRQAVLGPDGSGIVAMGDQQVVAEGKADMQQVNQEGKGNLETTDLRLPAPTNLSQLQ